jgi:hypothetical protein
MGLHYAVAPRKRDQLGLELAMRWEQEHKFVPDTSVSQSVVEVSRNRTKDVVDSLMESAERTKFRVDFLRARLHQERHEKEEKENKNFSFKPTLRKLPPGVQPKYRGMPRKVIEPLAISTAMSSQNASTDDRQAYDVEDVEEQEMSNKGHADEESPEVGVEEGPLESSSAMVEQALLSSSEIIEGPDDHESIEPLFSGHDDLSEVSDATEILDAKDAIAKPSMQIDSYLKEAFDDVESDSVGVEFMVANPICMSPMSLGSRRQTNLIVQIPSEETADDDITEVMTSPHEAYEVVSPIPPSRATSSKSVKFDELNIEATSPRGRRGPEMMQQSDKVEWAECQDTCVPPTSVLPMPESPRRRFAVLSPNLFQQKTSISGTEALSRASPVFFAESSENSIPTNEEEVKIPNAPISNNFSSLNDSVPVKTTTLLSSRSLRVTDIIKNLKKR